MTENKIGLKTISELLGMNFFIPSYQRGYRWTKQQVEDLLGDIYSFATKNKEKKEFYCLQPIVVKKCSKEEKEKNNLQSELDNNEWYEVVDGQQRLTTIKILISYLVKELYSVKTLYETHKKHPFEIEYETRKDSRLFLNSIEISKSNDDIDFYFISEAYDTIKKWFDSPKIEDPQQAKETIRNTILYGVKNQRHEGVVQIIWYEINEENNNPIDTFMRINMGKIPLTNAELIKALFLQKRNFGGEKDPELRQIEIANEWDKMEYALQNEDFWWFLNKEKNDIPARIEFLFELIYKLKRQESKQDFDDKFGTDEHKIFRYFSSLFADKEIKFDTIKEEWNKIKNYFFAFEEWFNKPVWYHYIGFLIYCGVSVIDIYKIYQNQKKDEFEKELIEEIKKQFEKIKCEKADENYRILLSYKSDKEKIRQLLLMFNVEFIVKQYKEIMTKYNGDEDDLFIVKFPFKIFKEEKWDIEHIYSYTPNSMNKFDIQKEWLETNKEDLKEDIDGKTMEEIEDFLNGKPSNFEELYKKLSVKTANEKEIDEDTKNSIGNLTLLSAEINRSYGNSLFPTKRRIIIKEDMQGKFIPICTKHIFLKYFDKKGTSRTKWSMDDITDYQNNIGTILNDFLTFKANNNE
jgi:hypothetical protein